MKANIRPFQARRLYSSISNPINQQQALNNATQPLNFVPNHGQLTNEDVEKLSKFVRNSQGGLLVVTGAGISTESGLPDYRSEGVGLYARSNRRPLQHMTFVKNEAARKSYWARNFVGWPRWSSALPNAAHTTLAGWERLNLLQHIITQNVDQLHFKAGSTKVLELHGTNSMVGCLSCSYKIPRQAFQSVLSELNPHLSERSTEVTSIRPDGDVDISTEDVEKFCVPSCPKCHIGTLKPIVVFFGDNVPKQKVQQTRQLVTDCSSLMIIGSSLHVFSGYRIVLQAKEEGKEVAILNIGTTRADHLADLKISVRAGDILPSIKL